jgi:hypothetical protein
MLQGFFLCHAFSSMWKLRRPRHDVSKALSGTGPNRLIPLCPAERNGEILHRWSTIGRNSTGTSTRPEKSSKPLPSGAAIFDLSASDHPLRRQFSLSCKDSASIRLGIT